MRDGMADFEIPSSMREKEEEEEEERGAARGQEGGARLGTHENEEVRGAGEDRGGASHNYARAQKWKCASSAKSSGELEPRSFAPRSLARLLFFSNSEKSSGGSSPSASRESHKCSYRYRCSASSRPSPPPLSLIPVSATPARLPAGARGASSREGASCRSVRSFNA